MERCSFNRNDPGYALDPLFHSKFSQYFVHNPNECKLALSKGVTRKNRYPRFVVASFSLLEILGEDCLQLSREREKEREKNYQLGNTTLVQTRTALPRLAYYAKS